RPAGAAPTRRGRRRGALEPGRPRRAGRAPRARGPRIAFSHHPVGSSLANACVWLDGLAYPPKMPMPIHSRESPGPSEVAARDRGDREGQMRTGIRVIAASLGGLLLISACAQTPQPGTSASPAGSAAASPAATNKTFIYGFTQNPVGGCDGTQITVVAT